LCYQRNIGLCDIALPCDLRKFLCHELNQDRVTVHLLGKSRLSNFLGMIAYLGLAVCVFTWGLQYKLSLYDPPQVSPHQIPQAKLLSKNEQIGTTGSPLVVRTKTSTSVRYTVPGTLSFILFLAIGILNPQGSCQRDLRTDQVRHFRRGQFDIFFVRPPPILA